MGGEVGWGGEGRWGGVGRGGEGGGKNPPGEDTR